jgi:hypothetical protein
VETACIPVEASLEYKKKDKELQGQAAMSFRNVPKEDLRVKSVLVNDPARISGMRLHPNWRVPSESATDDKKWKTLTGGQLAPEAGCLTFKYPSSLGRLATWCRH